MHTGPVIIGYDGSPASERAVRETGELLTGRRALVVNVWEPGTGFALIAEPTIPVAPIDIRTALEIDQAMAEAAQRMAQQGADLARAAGLDAEGLAVADDITVAETLVRLAKEHDAQCVAVGSHGHRAVREVLVGSTTRDVIRHAPCPVVVVYGAER